MSLNISELLEEKRKELTSDSDYIEELERLVHVGEEVEINQRARTVTLQTLLNDLDAFLQEDADYMESPLRTKVLDALPENFKNFR